MKEETVKSAEIVKPYPVAMEDAKVDIVNAINKTTAENNLSFFSLEIIVGAIYKEILENKRNQMKQERISYENQLKRKESEK